MKRLLVVVLLGGLVAVAGCSKKDSNPVGPTLPAAPAVNFTMHLESGTQGMIFVASPDADVKLSKVVVTYPPQQFVNTIENPDPTQLIVKGSNIQLGEYTGIEANQVWVLTFVGTHVASNKPFSITMNWTVI